jgi:TonB family protein
VLFGPEPSFPAIAKKAQIQGVVTGELSIGPAGRVEEVVIVEGLPMGLTQAAVAALETWRFAPARDGAPRRKVLFQTHFMKIQPEYHPDWNP